MWNAAYPIYTKRLAAMAYHVNTLGDQIIEGLALESLPVVILTEKQKVEARFKELAYRIRAEAVR